MSAWVRLLVAAAVWTAAAALGWWSQHAVDDAQEADAPALGPDVPVVQSHTGREDGAVRRLTAADPFVLRMLPTGLPGAASPGEVQSVEWRISALVVRGAERYVVLTSEKEPSLKVAQGQRLPDGDLVKSIEPGRVAIQSPRGRVRTVYLTEP